MYTYMYIYLYQWTVLNIIRNIIYQTVQLQETANKDTVTHHIPVMTHTGHVVSGKAQNKQAKITLAISGYHISTLDNQIKNLYNPLSSDGNSVAKKGQNEGPTTDLRLMMDGEKMRFEI